MSMRQSGTSTVGVLIVATLALSACGGGQLDRAEARRQLMEQHSRQPDYDYITVGSRDLTFLQVDPGAAFGDVFNTDHPGLLTAGLIEVRMIASQMPDPVYSRQIKDRYEVTFTERATPFVVGVYGLDVGICSFHRCAKVVVATVADVEILGVTEPADMFGQFWSTVEYRLTWSRTPFGDVLGSVVGGRTRKEDFVLYDDGWRISR